MYTGNTAKLVRIVTKNTVYPCVYREHARVRLSGWRLPGLSLCIQGTQRDNQQLTYAHQVYPCVYREHLCVRAVLVMMAGLSLCIQGTLIWQGGHAKKTRFIPVYTGNTLHITGADTVLPVYPCVYREHAFNVSIYIGFGGLSLCIQGTQIRSTRHH